VSAAAALSAALYLPVGIWVLTSHALEYRALGYAAVAGVLSSAVPFLADMLALKRVAAGFFGVFMSVNPVLAALIGVVLLGQALRWQEWLAIVAIVAANAISAGTAARKTRARVATRVWPAAAQTCGCEPPPAAPAMRART
jgi:inner membrane transporter RhtA